MNPREQFEKETGMTTGIMFAHSVGFRDEYVLWLEKLVEPKEKELQILMNEIRTWSDATFGDSRRTISILYHLIKEVPELIESIEKEETVITTLFEFADCFMLLLDAASHHGYKADDILLAMSDKLEINKKRKWGNPDENGVIEHIRDSSENPEPTRDELIKKAIEFYKLKYPYANSDYETWIRRIESDAIDAVDFHLEMKKNN
jgi:NTP pyrophosphatase (non-canonical NTP hydrolase)